MLGVDAARRWNTELHFKCQEEKEGAEGQAGRMERRKLVISGGLAVQVASLDVREQMRFKDAIL